MSSSSLVAVIALGLTLIALGCQPTQLALSQVHANTIGLYLHEQKSRIEAQYAQDVRAECTSGDVECATAVAKRYEPGLEAYDRLRAAWLETQSLIAAASLGDQRAAGLLLAATNKLEQTFLATKWSIENAGRSSGATPGLVPLPVRSKSCTSACF